MSCGFLNSFCSKTALAVIMSTQINLQTSRSRKTDKGCIPQGSSTFAAQMHH
jgi:hypothetical protein